MAMAGSSNENRIVVDLELSYIAKSLCLDFHFAEFDQTLTHFVEYACRVETSNAHLF